VQAGGVAATAKHFIANDSETERMTLDARIDERTLRELYLPPFEAVVVEAGACSVMAAAYNGVNGESMTESSLLRELLQDELGFDGVVMSDWYAARRTEQTGRAGLDLSMPGPDGPWGDALVAAVTDGRVPATAVEDKVLRLLRLAARVVEAAAGETVTAVVPLAPRAFSHWDTAARAWAVEPGPFTLTAGPSCAQAALRASCAQAALRAEIVVAD
jgi:beta-glucosidase